MSIVRLPAGDDKASTLIIGDPLQAALDKGDYFQGRQGLKYAQRFDERLAYRRIPKRYIEQSVIFTASHLPLKLQPKYLRGNYKWSPINNPRWANNTSFDPHTNTFSEVMYQIDDREYKIQRRRHGRANRGYR
ncbi:hypothetical protein I350_04784 [Cryptococcus amylolentus CBS 6273]|uniref:Uncharacterized protein n=1 Tax=Cryptococcus amylolentus CBS 6273 TaxID=1296118 RepID=A0A1E3JXX9_9TREE|nr:hypothetical protein I350_04784 [Cryptococcus amylolentus CBS 6273]